MRSIGSTDATPPPRPPRLAGHTRAGERIGELAILLRNPPSDDDPTRLGIAGPLTHATTPILRDYLRRLMDTTAGRPRIVLDMSCCTGIAVASCG